MYPLVYILDNPFILSRVHLRIKGNESLSLSFIYRKEIYNERDNTVFLLKESYTWTEIMVSTNFLIIGLNMVLFGEKCYILSIGDYLVPKLFIICLNVLLIVRYFSQIKIRNTLCCCEVLLRKLCFFGPLELKVQTCLVDNFSTTKI